MELKDGYKKTDVGVIPKEWNVRELGSIGNFKNGINKSKEDFGFGHPFVNLLDVFGKSEIISNIQLELINSNDGERNLYNLKKGDILFIRSSVKPSGVGLTTLIREDLFNTVFSGFLIRFRINEIMNNDFKKHCFNEEGFRNRLISNSTVSANTNINQEKLKKLKLIIPPLPEQQAIAEVLSDTDNLIQSLEKQIAKKRLIKQGAMQKLLTPKEGWEEKSLGEVASMYSGGTPDTENESYYRGNINWITSGDLNQGFIYEVTGRISEKGLKNSSAKEVTKGTLLIAMYGATAGVSAISLINGAINQAILAVVTSDICNAKFLFYQFQLKKEWIINTYTQGGQPNLSGKIIKSITLSFPSIAVQEEISCVLQDLDKEIEILIEKLSKYKQLKQGLMQNLLTGKIRLI